jgi:hypothetical protein
MAQRGLMHVRQLATLLTVPCARKYPNRLFDEQPFQGVVTMCTVPFIARCSTRPGPQAKASTSTQVRP